MSHCDAAAVRPLSIPVILIALLGLLAGCTPADEPILGLAVQDGQPIGILVTCDAAFSLVSVDEDNKDNASDRTMVSWGVSGRAKVAVIDVPLLGQPPDGWKVDDIREMSGAEAGTTVKIEPLTELEPGVRYSLSGLSRRYAMSVDFTTADFARIGPDKVLAPTSRGKMKIMSRDTFVRIARKGCD